MRDRRIREARKAEEAARQRQLQEEEEETRRRQLEEQVVGVGDDPTQPRPVTGRPQAQATQGYSVGGVPGGAPASSSRRQENIPATPRGPVRPAVPLQPAGAQPSGAGPRVSANTQRNRTEAYETLNVPAPAKPAGQPEPLASGSQQPPATGKTGFPHAFERWETLSSHWEGLTSYWIRRLQQNTEELSGKPIDQQMARQIADLSAAGANLFHAVVELQRLRASSERKFQRWFFETRDEQEQAQERQAELERQLRAEREARAQSSTAIEAARAEKTRAEELVREMRRELQISKEEARRAWEELGRREQEERERTVSLRSGEPTLVGGVQVVPMQGFPSRQVSSAQRPQTRDGPYAGAPGPSMAGGQQRPPSRSQTATTTTTSLDSPGEERRQFTYQPEPDPFTETSRRPEPSQPLRHETDTQFYATPPRPTQPQTSAAAVAAARSATSGPSPSRGYQQFPQPELGTAAAAGQAPSGGPAPGRTGTAGTERSYIPSTASATSEEEYHINPDGSYTRDAQGRRIPYRQPIGGPAEGQEEEEEDYGADIEREQMYAQQYRPQAPAQQPPPSVSTRTPRTTSGNLPPIPQGRTVTYEPVAGTATAPAQQPETQPEYEGQGYGPSGSATGWENISVTPRHRHPTRLSDIIEEQTARTSPSRTSYVSGTGLPGDAGTGGGNNTGSRQR